MVPALGLVAGGVASGLVGQASCRGVRPPADRPSVVRRRVRRANDGNVGGRARRGGHRPRRHRPTTPAASKPAAGPAYPRNIPVDSSEDLLEVLAGAQRRSR